MVFSSAIFLFLFLPIVLAANFLLPRSARNVALFLSSILFYAWGGVEHLPLLLALILINWISGIYIDRSESDRRRDLALIAIVVIDVSGLVFYKYTGFLVDNLNLLLELSGRQLPHGKSIILPLGISFFTFHLISYVVDIHRGVARAQRSPINFGLYICFFPQLIAGPIIRYHDVEAQLTDRDANSSRFASGVERFSLGLAKKVLLANPFGFTVDRIFGLGAEQLSPAVAWFGLMCYGLQLYFDFSGYSDMAIGLGRMFGFEFLENFNYPYMATSVSEFWRRWHISLSNWFRDYFYSPLVFTLARRAARKADKSPYRYDDRWPLAFVFLICGIWHGANWTFAVFGAIHGMFLFLERGRLGVWLRSGSPVVGRSYLLLVTGISWVFFRSVSLQSAMGYLHAMFGYSGAESRRWVLGYFADQRVLILLPVALLACTPVFSRLTRDWRARAAQSFGQIALDEDLAEPPTTWPEKGFQILRPIVAASLLILSMVYIAGATYNPFIYFRF